MTSHQGVLRTKVARAMRKLSNAIASEGVPSLGSRECPICDFTGSFQVGGQVFRRPDARCPRCGSLERHRLLRRFLEGSDVLNARPRLLHFAPEPAISDFVRPRCSEYVTADYLQDGVDLRLNIEAMDLPDASFDAVICSDVLEHVDDGKALRELYRILSPGGVAMLHVPIAEGLEHTYEDPAITDEPGRLLHFGQPDHVRLYGRDFRRRIEAPGFTLEEFASPVPECITYSLIVGERIFLGRKPRP